MVKPIRLDRLSQQTGRIWRRFQGNNMHAQGCHVEGVEANVRPNIHRPAGAAVRFRRCLDDLSDEEGFLRFVQTRGIYLSGYNVLIGREEPNYKGRVRLGRHGYCSLNNDILWFLLLMGCG